MGEGRQRGEDSGQNRGRQRIAGREAVFEGQKARQCAACPEPSVGDPVCPGVRAHLDRTASWPACGWLTRALLESADAGRSTGFEGILRLAALAFAVADIAALIQRLEGLQDGSVGGLGRQARAACGRAEQPAQCARDREGPVPVGHGGENLAGELFGEEHGGLGLATGAEISGAARERQKVFGVTSGTAQGGKASLRPATGKELFDRAHHDRPRAPERDSKRSSYGRTQLSKWS